MASSPRLPLLDGGEVDEPPPVQGLQGARLESLGPDSDPQIMKPNSGLDAQKPNPSPRSTSHSNLPRPAEAEASSRTQVGPEKLRVEIPSGPGVGRVATGTKQDRAPQQSQTALANPGSPTGNANSAWWKRVGMVKSKIGSTREKSAQEGKAVETEKVETAKPEAKGWEAPKLVDLSNLALPVLPSIDIIAIHDLGQSLTTAWCYTPEKSFAKRPSGPSKQPPAAPGPANGNRPPFPPKQPSAFEAGLKALAKVKSRDETRRGHIQGWTDSLHVEQADAPARRRKDVSVGPDQVAPDVVPPAPVGEPPLASLDKGKTRADGEGTAPVGDGERGRPTQLPTQQQMPQAQQVSQVPPRSDKKPDDDDRTSRYSNRPSSNKGSRAPSESLRDKSMKTSNWLTDRTMLPSDLDRARVRAFSYKLLEPTQLPENAAIKKPDYEKYLKETAESLFSKLEASDIPLVFIATGFGCLIVQKLIALAAESEEDSAFLDSIAAVLFLDTPIPVAPDNANFAKTEKEKKTTPPILPPPVSTSRTARVKAILESKGLNSWDLWTTFHDIVKNKEVSTVWFYTPPVQVPNRNASSPRAKGVDFVKLEPGAAKPTTGTNRSWSRFRGPGDPNYRSFIDQIKRLLLLKASASKKLEELLSQYIICGYNLSVKDHRRRCPLHRAAADANDAALIRLVTAQPTLVIERDEDGLTPLHTVISKIISVGPPEPDRAPYRMMVEKLLLALGDMQQVDDIKDNSGKSAWDYAFEENHHWIRELRESRFLRPGAQTARRETLEQLVETVRPSPAEMNACRRSEAALAQFYVSKDGTKDFLDPLRPDVSAVLYNPHYGVDMLFERNRRQEEDKQPTCRWIHLPANNEKWIHDLFVRQLGRIDKSMSGRRHRGSAPFDHHIVPGAFRYNQISETRPGETPFAPPGSYPFPSPSGSFSIKSTDGLGTSKRTVTALFMPVFGFEEHGNRKKMTLAMRKPSECSGTDQTSQLIRAYSELDKSPLHCQDKFDKFPLHCRRTLDQFTYHMLKDTERRDNSQVMFRWANKGRNRKDRAGQPAKQRWQSSSRFANDSKGQLPVLMVDQLWLWVLEDDKTVITSLPNTWESNKKYNLVRHLMHQELVGNNNRPLIKSSMDLANTIIRCSVDFLQRPGPRDVTLYECFQSSITIIAEEQALQFRQFKRLVKNLNQEGLDEQTRANLTNSLFQLTTETRLLAEIMDIQDELKTIQSVFLKQREVLKTFVKLLSDGSGQSKDKADDESDITDPHESSPYPPTSPFFTSEDGDAFESPYYSPHPLSERKSPLPSALYRDAGRPRVRRSVQFADDPVSSYYQRSKAWDQAEENLNLVESNIATIKEMTMYAEKVRVEINGLLSHRQKQANAWEARFAREGSEHTQRQSNITLVFTLVTVVFLPLSFLSSVLAIQIDAFPHDTESGEVNWPLNQVMGLIFGISSAMIILIGFLGFYSNRMWRFYKRHFGRATTPLGTSRPGGRSHHDSDSDSDSSSTLTGTRQHSRTRSERSTRSQDPISVRKEKQYGLLFGVWNFHTKIPFVKKFWEYRYYRPDPRTMYRPVYRPDGEELVEVWTTISSWGEEEEWDIATNDLEWDYPLHRALLLSAKAAQNKILNPLARLMPAWLRKGDDSTEDESPPNLDPDYHHTSNQATIDFDNMRAMEEAQMGQDEQRALTPVPSSLERSSVSAPSVDSWEVPPSPPLITRRTFQNHNQQTQRRQTRAAAAAGIIGMPWRWLGTVGKNRTRNRRNRRRRRRRRGNASDSDAGTSSTTTTDSEGEGTRRRIRTSGSASVGTSVDVAHDPDDYYRHGYDAEDDDDNDGPGEGSSRRRRGRGGGERGGRGNSNGVKGVGGKIWSYFGNQRRRTVAGEDLERGGGGYEPYADWGKEERDKQQ